MNDETKDMDSARAYKFRIYPDAKRQSGIEVGEEVTYNTNVLEALAKLESESIDCIVTSPPYWGLRDYGEGTTTIWDAKEGCQHEWQVQKVGLQHENRNNRTGTQEEVMANPTRTTYIMKFRGVAHGPNAIVGNTIKEVQPSEVSTGNLCSLCGAWKGQLGLEPDYHDYLKHLLQVTAELKRVLKLTGTLWWNIGQTYAGSMQSYGAKHDSASGFQKAPINAGFYAASSGKPPMAKVAGIPDKCLMQLPERLSIKMVDEQGWILRNDCVWWKPNHMPSSVKDRLGNAWEHIYLFTKQRKYYFNLDAIRVPVAYPQDVVRRIKQDALAGVKSFAKGTMTERHSFNQRVRDAQKGRLQAKYGDMYKATEQEIANYDEKHYKGNMVGSAINSEALGSPRARNSRESNKTKSEQESTGWSSRYETQKAERRKAKETGDTELIRWIHEHGGNPIGKNPGDVWRITTKPYREAHFATFPPDLPERAIKAGCPEGGTVLDPFAGSGTTLMVALKLNRNAIGIEIKKEYCDLINKRCDSYVKQNHLPH